MRSCTLSPSYVLVVISSSIPGFHHFVDSSRSSNSGSLLWHPDLCRHDGNIVDLRHHLQESWFLVGTISSLKLLKGLLAIVHVSLQPAERLRRHSSYNHTGRV